MSTITDAQIEAACEAFYGSIWHALNDGIREHKRQLMRAALEAAEQAATSPANNLDLDNELFDDELFDDEDSLVESDYIPAEYGEYQFPSPPAKEGE